MTASRSTPCSSLTCCISSSPTVPCPQITTRSFEGWMNTPLVDSTREAAAAWRAAMVGSHTCICVVGADEHHCSVVSLLYAV
eukprot:20569-Eustigmatos_ZCMA.PRE.1